MTRPPVTRPRSPLAAIGDAYDPPLHPHLHDPAGWVRDVTGEHLWSKQVEIAEALERHRKVAVKAGHGVGKSFFAGRAVAWWLDVHADGEAFAVTTAPTDPQVKAILWQEIRHTHRLGKLAGRVSENAEWKNAHGDLVAMGRKPSDHNEHAFQGLHRRYLLAVLDEACGIPKQLWDAALSLTTNATSRILAIGNPTDPQSEFEAVCNGAPEDGSSGWSKRGWWVITVSAFDSPNLTGEPVPEAVSANVTDQSYIDEARLNWGEGSALWVSKVEGRFPEDASDGTIPWSWIQACRGEEATARIGGLRVPVELGVDVGGSDNGDESVVVARAGMQAFDRVWTARSGDSEVVVDLVIEAVRDTGATSVKVDSIGVGHGVVGSLRRRVAAEVRWPVEVHGVNVAGAAPPPPPAEKDPQQFVNLRAWLWWKIGRVYSQERVWDLSGIDDQTQRDLSEPRYFERNGRIQIEEKGEVRKRLGRSPDRGDALLLAFYVPPAEPVATVTSYDSGSWSAGRR